MRDQKPTTASTILARASAMLAASKFGSFLVWDIIISRIIASV